MQIRNSNRNNNRKDDNVSAVSLHQVWQRLCSRMGNLGTYRLLQINGQRKFFDPLSDTTPMVDGCELFVGRLPRDMFEDELVPLFALHGPIHELRLMMNFSGTNRGFAFVMYKEPQFAEEAIKKLNDFEVREGQFIGVVRSVNNRRLYIGRLHPSGANESNLLKLLSTLTEGLQSLSLHTMTKGVNQKVPRKCAIAVYVSHRHAAMARRFLILGKNELFQDDIVVDWASPSLKFNKCSGRDRSPSIVENIPNPSTSSTEIPKIPGPGAVPRSLPNAARRFQKAPHDHPKSDGFEEEKTARPIIPLRVQKDEPIGYTDTKGLCYSRLNTPLYSLSPVPKPNSLVHLRPPPSVRTSHELQENGSLPQTPNSVDKGKQRPKEEKKRYRKPAAKCTPRLLSTRPCGLPGSA